MKPSHSSYDRGHLTLGLLVFSFLGACGDSGAGGKAKTDGSLDGRDARVNPGSDGSDVLSPTNLDVSVNLDVPANLDVSNSDTTPQADVGPTDVAADSVAMLPDVPLLDSGRDGPGPLLEVASDGAGPLLDTGDNDIARRDTPPA